MLACGLAVTLQRRQEIKIMEMEKTYNPAAIEEKIYDRWLQKKYFHAALRFTFPGERFSMVLFHFKSLHPLLKVERRCFGFFGRMLHLAPRMLHPVDIDSSDGHNCWIV